ncbi:lipopolysaccharide transport periplasmic protein LptA [Thalassomonas sp. M1454]|uniref:lipopolysaccharide transport periplasmic protein LptA n=1 Tax=Thalassomonas sp. M1454 TaxID=2594477 RepID=UPI0021B0991A|nr:lipopolysaccharide transport periplasmic protein LptA [Thalassomonas sp. M1454]
MTHKLLLSLALLSSSSLYAASVDLEQEIKIVAKKQSSDLKNKVASYLEDVKITQGSLSIEADLVQVANEPGSERKFYLAKGKPAKFSQLLEDGQKIELQANEISYSPSSNTIIIKGNASISQEGSMVTGDIITYNITTEQLTAESTGSVTTILKPETETTNDADTKQEPKQQPIDSVESKLVGDPSEEKADIKQPVTPIEKEQE